MKKLGVVENLSYDGSILVRSEFAPPRGAHVVDRRNRPLGSVVRVFGPVKEPFVSVRPKGSVTASVVGIDVFVAEGNHADEEDRRGRRSH